MQESPCHELSVLDPAREDVALDLDIDTEVGHAIRHRGMRRALHVRLSLVWVLCLGRVHGVLRFDATISLHWLADGFL